ncbi:N-acetyl sugar amidotransferase [bacterium]|nr:N-acetyl sugar amidotransferase [bacterium]
MITFCKTCIMPNSRPRIVFNDKGICNACENGNEKVNTDWTKRNNEFLNLVKEIKENSDKNNLEYDCIVPWSGGKDSTSIALKLKLDFNLKPLLVTFSPLLTNEIGEFNRKLILNHGFDSIFINPNQNVARTLAKRFFIERGNPKVAWDAGINAAPIKIAIKFKIPYIFYAEHGESEYGGLTLSEESKKKRDLREVIEHQIGDYPENWVNDEISLRDLSPYVYPDEKELRDNNINAYYFAYFYKWSMLENYNYVKEIIPNFKTDASGRTSGTFTDFDSLDDKIDPLYYYMQYIKFGFGRASRDACRMIQNNQMTREQAVKLAKNYDNEFPKENLNEILEYLDLSSDKLEDIINKHRNKEIWRTSINNKWELINSL